MGTTKIFCVFHFFFHVLYIALQNITFDVVTVVESSWNLKTRGDAREGKWRGNWRTEWVASTLHTNSEHGVSSITTAVAHISAASSRLNFRPCWFKWTRPFRRKTKSGFCACVITFQTQSTTVWYQININISDLTQIQYMFMFWFLVTCFGPHKDHHLAFMYKNFNKGKSACQNTTILRSHSLQY